jgi:hypothetical protein
MGVVMTDGSTGSSSMSQDDLIERIARLIYDADALRPRLTWERLTPLTQGEYRKEARAALSAFPLAEANTARLSELERENARLREALKPFASEGALWHDSTTTPTEDEPLWISSYETRRSPDEAKFTLGDLRRARAALAGSGEK